MQKQYCHNDIRRCIEYTKTYIKPSFLQLNATSRRMQRTTEEYTFTAYNSGSVWTIGVRCSPVLYKTVSYTNSKLSVSNDTVLLCVQSCNQPAVYNKCPPVEKREFPSNQIHRLGYGNAHSR